MRDLLQRPDLFSINTATLAIKRRYPPLLMPAPHAVLARLPPGAGSCRVKISSKSPGQLAASNMNVSGLCRSTYYTAPTLAERKLAIDDNRRRWTTPLY